MKHREAWTRIAQGDSDLAVIAEDDIIISPRSLEYLIYLIDSLPTGADYIDIAGGGGDITGPDGTTRYIPFKPRVGNKCVNKHFFEIFPPKTRTTCGAIVTRLFARRLIDLNPPICLGIDWMLNWAFVQLATKVYWVEPTVFGHGSQINIYNSIREAERRE
jgi:GR25 family glycosyltransferase involved in LPS biosynthesis